ncbi:response regulator transcription factor [Halomonas sp. HP20-15]|uniref:response regulator transcription factor n=1 Tax=Halomonas sp. HP20-15 TaxID=3085901 RepID=UPI0029814A49|nr:response regulator transcription factor [Halomonas sp. HP20-15]MDW5377685.1 response regulator transcription factor [Halomonas sp. HP20-15]
MRILVIEDDVILGDGLCEGLRLDGHTVDWLTDGDDALHALEADEFDVAVLDLALPGCSGLEVLAHWRRANQQVPVLVLTAYGDTHDCITALDQGADDYVSKPVDLAELEARLRALLRRANGHADNCLQCGAVSLDRSDRIVRIDETSVELSAYEFAVLEALLERSGRVISREQLESRLYGWGDGPESNSLHVLIHKLRSRIGARRIETVRGLGYRIVP